MARYDFIPAVLTGTDDSGLGHALIPDAGHHGLHFLVITDLEGMIFEGVEFGQLDINNLFLLARAWSLGGSRRCFSLNGSLYLRCTLSGTGSLGGFLCLFGGSGLFRFSRLCRFLYCLILLAGRFFLCGSFGLIRGWSLGSGLLLLGNLCVHFGLGRGRARARPGCVSYDFCFFIGHSHFLLLI